MRISKKIRGLRKKAGYSQVILAEILNIDKGTVSAWERGAQKPGSDNICALTKVFGITSDELLGLGRRRADLYGQEFGWEFRPGFLQKCNLDIERLAGLGLSELMEERGISRAELAKFLEITPKTVYNWESKGLPFLGYYKKIVSIFDLDKETFQSLK